jgi:hypothetical protein
LYLEGPVEGKRNGRSYTALGESLSRGGHSNEADGSDDGELHVDGCKARRLLRIEEQVMMRCERKSERKSERKGERWEEIEVCGGVF